MTEAERRLWYQLRRRQLNGFYFRRQTAMKNYIVDFVCHEAKLVIEIDGGQHADRISYDGKRTSWLNSQGYRVIRFWNNEVMENFAGIIEIIRSELENLNRTPPP